MDNKEERDYEVIKALAKRYDGREKLKIINHQKKESQEFKGITYAFSIVAIVEYINALMATSNYLSSKETVHFWEIITTLLVATLGVINAIRNNKKSKEAEKKAYEIEERILESRIR